MLSLFAGFAVILAGRWSQQDAESKLPHLGLTASGPESRMGPAPAPFLPI